MPLLGKLRVVYVYILSSSKGETSLAVKVAWPIPNSISSGLSTTPHIRALVAKSDGNDLARPDVSCCRREGWHAAAILALQHPAKGILAGKVLALLIATSIEMLRTPNGRTMNHNVEFERNI